MVQGLGWYAWFVLVEYVNREAANSYASQPSWSKHIDPYTKSL